VQDSATYTEGGSRGPAVGVTFRRVSGLDLGRKSDLWLCTREA